MTRFFGLPICGALAGLLLMASASRAQGREAKSILARAALSWRC